MITIKFRRGTSLQWAETNFILEAGEPGYATDTGVYKIGDGFNKWNDLSSYMTFDAMEAAVSAMVNAAVDEITFDTNDFITLMDDHIHDDTPHPVYDDGPSLYLLYLNAKA